MEEVLGYARKYRTTTLEGYVGNESIKATVKNYLRKGRPQQYLIKGPSGCGKTTVARVISKIYCCEDPIDGYKPCGVCQTCQNYDEFIRTGNTEMLPDLYEIDASDTSGKKDIDILLSSMEYPAVSGDWKVYIIDEAHLLSKGAMGRLLKTLEEPPEGVLIMLCTTNPEDLLDTIVNRCVVKLEVTKPSTVEIMELLQKVCLAEDRNYDLPGLRMLVTRANNVIRASLNNLELVINTRGDACHKSVVDEFKVLADGLILDFYNYYFNQDTVGYMNTLYKVKSKYNLSDFVRSVISFTIRGIYVINSVDVEGLTQEEITTYMNLFSQFSPRELSTVLHELKGIFSGDLEVNLMYFMYVKSNPPEVAVKPIVKLEESKEEELRCESKMRNDNLKTIQQALLKEGMDSVKEEVKEVSVSDIETMFSLEKVE